MNSRNYRIADLTLRIDFKGELSLRQARPYLIEDDAEPDIEINLARGDYQNCFKLNYDDPEELEHALTRFAFQRELLKFDGLVLHASAVVSAGQAYLFSANSGVGKSTQTGFWLKRFAAENAFLLNDDAPALRKFGGSWFAYGTPWAGSTRINVNAKAPLRAIAFIERSEKSWSRRLSEDEALPLFLQQSMRPPRRKELERAIDSCARLVADIPIFKMGRPLDPDSIVVARDAMDGQPAPDSL
ncbi:MAG: hypothetical protein IJM30_02290 [Thermoguttaceae bacterium]|nr:hypothetical protein [Thermoguttaceae bacterium]